MTPTKTPPNNERYTKKDQMAEFRTFVEIINQDDLQENLDEAE